MAGRRLSPKNNHGCLRYQTDKNRYSIANMGIFSASRKKQPGASIPSTSMRHTGIVAPYISTTAIDTDLLSCTSGLATAYPASQGPRPNAFNNAVSHFYGIDADIHPACFHDEPERRGGITINDVMPETV